MTLSRQKVNLRRFSVPGVSLIIHKRFRLPTKRNCLVPERQLYTACFYKFCSIIQQIYLPAVLWIRIRMDPH
jgi:hypothetical protein